MKTPSITELQKRAALLGAEVGVTTLEPYCQVWVNTATGFTDVDIDFLNSRHPSFACAKRMAWAILDVLEAEK